MDISTNRLEMEATIQEFLVDYNQHHFIRDQQFYKPFTQFDDVEFLERSCTAEFSVFYYIKNYQDILKQKIHYWLKASHLCLEMKQDMLDLKINH